VVVALLNPLRLKNTRDQRLLQHDMERCMSFSVTEAGQILILGTALDFGRCVHPPPHLALSYSL
jgi:hypothetical protein